MRAIMWQAGGVRRIWSRAQRAQPSTPPKIERMGGFSTTSGELILIDFGNLAFWSGDQPPAIPDGLLDPELAQSMNQSGDFEIVGRDAEQAAERLNMVAVNGTHAFDVPGDASALHERLGEIRAEFGLDAELHAIDRMPHRERVRTLLDREPAGAEVPFHGIWAVAVRDVPANEQIAIFGERMDEDGPDTGRWKSVWAEVASGQVAASQQVGFVLVDRARLMFADPDALATWNASAPELIDLVFWGRDAESVAAQVSADAFVEGGQAVYGWRNRRIDEIRELGAMLRAHLEETSARVATDFRPHDDDYRILEAMREAPTETADIKLGDRLVCGFFTTWGDGAFPVYRDVDAGGRLLRVRVELGAPEIVARTRRMEELWFGSLSKLAIASPTVMGGAPVRWLERDHPRDDNDSGWCVYAGTETQEELDDPGAATLVPLRDLIRTQPDLETVLANPAPAAFELADDGTWHSIPLSHD